MECVNDTNLIIIMVVSLIVGFGICWTANLKDEYFEHVMDFDDDYQDRVG